MVGPGRLELPPQPYQAVGAGSWQYRSQETIQSIPPSYPFVIFFIYSHLMII